MTANKAPDPGQTPPPARVPCPVCEGKGGWGRFSGAPLGPLSPAERVKCLYCDGEGKVPAIPRLSELDK